MPKFKKGDKVICVMDSDDGSFFGHPGEEFTVYTCHGNGVIFEEMTFTEVAVDVNRFELLPKQEKESELESLIRVANKGLEAEHQLLTKYCREVERCISNNQDKWYPFRQNPYSSYSVYRVKPKPAFEPFYVGKKTCCGYDPITKTGFGHDGPCTTGEYLVHFKDGELFIGTEVFKPKELRDGLNCLCNNNADAFLPYNGQTMTATRNGVWYKDLNFSWADADKILNALEEVVEKK